jgi:non-ribosomal peptide synthetase component E (peptide arylation enzyme)
MSATVRTLIEAQARQRPQAIYACTPQEQAQAEGQGPGQAAFTFSELARSCRQTAAWLCALGSQPGETVSVVMPNGL